jgi:uncharacterized protein
MNELQDREFIGRGLSFPLQLDPRGGVSLASGVNEIEQSIKIILGTIPGERVMRPTFGCRAWELIFHPSHSGTHSLVALYVREALSMWEPRITLDDIRAGNDPLHDGAILCEIRYTIRDTHDPRSIVYPFYIADEEG